tara:strand:+ start:550 stop:696 length:147 start_codon:yes stop_codon:yes gene_type:complete
MWGFFEGHHSPLSDVELNRGTYPTIPIFDLRDLSVDRLSIGRLLWMSR